MLRLRSYAKNIGMIIFILMLLLVYPSPVQTSAEISFADYEVPLEPIFLPENVQQEVWLLCTQHHLAYELILAILHTEGKQNAKLTDISNMMKELAYYRDYWTAEGYSNETVYDLLLLSRERGLEGCQRYLENNDSFNNALYNQKVTAYKYYLEQLDQDGIAKEPAIITV